MPTDLQHLPIDYRTVFSAMPGASGLLLPNAPEFTIVASTKEFAAFAGAEMDEFIGSSLFKYFPDNPDAPVVSSDIRASLAKCMETRQINELDAQRYDIADADGVFREMYWTVIHTPILDDSGEIAYIIHTAVDNTDRILAAQKDERIKSLEPAHNLFMQSTVAIHILKGEDMVVALANEPTLKLWHIKESPIGKPLLEVIPEIASQGYMDLLRNVLRSGEPFIANEAPVVFSNNEQQQTSYVNFILQPYIEPGDSKPSAVVAMVTEVTDVYNNRKALAEKERSLELAVEIGDLGVFNIDLKSDTVSYSPQIMEWFGVTQLNLPIEELLRKVHPDDYETVHDTLTRLAKGHKSWSHDIIFRVPNPETGEMQHLRSIGQVQAEDGVPVTLSGIIQDISNVVHSKEEVEQSNQRLRSLIESAPFPIGVYVGEEMRIVMANQSIIDVWDKGSDIVGKTYHEVLPELEGLGIYERLDAVYKTGQAYHAHNQQVNLFVDGKLRPFFFNYSFTPLFDSSGNVYGVMNTAADVTDLNVAKRKIEESEYRYRMLIEESSVATALYVGPELKIQYANKLMTGYWGKDESVIGQRLETAVPELVGQPFLDMLDYVYRTGETVSDTRARAMLEVDGELNEYFFNFTYKALRDANGEVYGIHHMAIDVTTEVRAHKTVAESERNFRSMILQAPVAICILRGEEHRFSTVNHMMEELIGRSAADVEDKPLFEAMPELHDRGLEPVLREVLDKKVSYLSEEQEFSLLRNGKFESTYIRYIYEPMVDASDHVEGIMVVATDVTQQVLARRKIEDIVASRTQELAEANQRLQQSNAELEQFAYIASHDLQEPLRKISLFTQMLENSLDNLNDRARHQMERINNSVGRMTNLIRDILGYSQLSRKNDVFVMTNLEQVLSEAIADFDLILQEKGGSISHRNLPVLEAIPLQMVQLFNNLVSNSLKYTRRDVAPKIEITGAKLGEDEVASHRLPEMPNGYHKLSFRDNGIGFAQEYADKIFQIFQRLHGKMQYEGTGIGLAMCRKIAENHKGLIYAVGHENEGAEFVVILPAKQS